VSEVTDQSKLLSGVTTLDYLLGQPTKLSGREFDRVRLAAIDWGRRCYFNSGWYAGKSAKPLPGSASTLQLFKDFVPLVDKLTENLKPKRGRGRPTKDKISGPDLVIIVEYLRDRTGRSLASIINAGIKKGYSLDPLKTTEAHEKRIKRLLEKLKKIHLPSTNNVLQFPSDKTRRRKIKSD